jgi:hypothetical protein
MSEEKPKKKTIPKVLKQHTWNKYVGEEVGKTKCFCCEINEIVMTDFHCGHVIAEANNGVTSIENLRPICKACNLSMKTENMEEFKKRCTFGIETEVKTEKKVSKKKKEPKVEEPKETDETLEWEPELINKARPKFFKIPMIKVGPFTVKDKEKLDVMNKELKGLYNEIPNNQYMVSIYGENLFRRITSKNSKDTDEILEWSPDILYKVRPKKLSIPDFKEPIYSRMMVEIQGLYIKNKENIYEKIE